MRTNIEINDDLMSKVMNATGLKTKKAVIEKALQELFYQSLLQDLDSIKDKDFWTGNLDKMRTQNIQELR
jgi:Arc/MetJ family transcription regulator